MVSSHPHIGTVDMTEPGARSNFSTETLKIYQSSFTALYSALTRLRLPSHMKLVCVGPEEMIVGIHGIGMDERL